MMYVSSVIVMNSRAYTSIYRKKNKQLKKKLKKTQPKNTHINESNGISTDIDYTR